MPISSTLPCNSQLSQALHLGSIKNGNLVNAPLATTNGELFQDWGQQPQITSMLTTALAPYHSSIDTSK